MLVTAALLAALVLPANARAELPTLAGTWTATPMRVDWKLGDWGAACGPAPSGGGAPGGTVTITSAGGELTMQGGAGRTFTTNECWEQFPGLARVSHSQGARRFQTTCQTAKSDPRQAKLVTTHIATDDRIDFDETGQYQFVIEGQNCTASVRRTRSLTLVSRLGEAPPAPSAAPVVSAAPKPPERRCQSTGLPERLEVRPSRKLMRPGETFDFRTVVVDASGCPLAVTPAWRVLGGKTTLRVPSAGRVVAAPDAPESEIELEVTLGDRSVRVVVEIASRERYDALLQSRGLDESGESKDAAVLRVASESLGSREVVVNDASRDKRRLVIGVAGGAALLLGALGLFLVSRSRRASVVRVVATEEPPLAATPAGKVCPTCRDEFPSTAEFCPRDGNRLVALGALPPGPGGNVCPVCGRGFDPGVSVCPEHGEELIPAVAVRPTAPAAPVRTICPMCGSQYGSEVRFCGECGAAVVPIN